MRGPRSASGVTCQMPGARETTREGTTKGVGLSLVNPYTIISDKGKERTIDAYSDMPAACVTTSMPVEEIERKSCRIRVRSSDCGRFRKEPSPICSPWQMDRATKPAFIASALSRRNLDDQRPVAFNNRQWRSEVAHSLPKHSHR